LFVPCKEVHLAILSLIMSTRERLPLSLSYSVS
jgi:hypothetical protein